MKTKMRYLTLIGILIIFITDSKGQRKYHDYWEIQSHASFCYQLNSTSFIRFNQINNSNIDQPEYGGLSRNNIFRFISVNSTGLTYNKFLTNKLLVQTEASYERYGGLNSYMIGFKANHLGNIGNSIRFYKGVSYAHQRYQQPNVDYSYILPENKLSVYAGIYVQVLDKIFLYSDFFFGRTREQSTKQHQKIERDYRFIDHLNSNLGITYLSSSNVSWNFYISKNTDYYLTSGNEGCDDPNNNNCKYNFIRYFVGVKFQYLLSNMKYDETFERVSTLNW